VSFLVEVWTLEALALKSLIKKAWIYANDHSIIAGLIVLGVSLVTWDAARNVLLQILSYSVPVWCWLLWMLLSYLLILGVRRTFRPSEKIPDWYSHTSMDMYGVSWRWRWSGTRVHAITPHCPDCAAELHYARSDRTIHLTCDSCQDNKRETFTWTLPKKLHDRLRVRSSVKGEIEGRRLQNRWQDKET